MGSGGQWPPSHPPQTPQVLEGLWGVRPPQEEPDSGLGVPHHGGCPRRGSKLGLPRTEATPKVSPRLDQEPPGAVHPRRPLKMSQVSTQVPPGSATPPPALCGAALGTSHACLGTPPKGFFPFSDLQVTPPLGTILWTITGDPWVWIAGGLGSPTPTPSASPGPPGILRPGHCPASTASPGPFQG